MQSTKVKAAPTGAGIKDASLLLFGLFSLLSVGLHAYSLISPSQAEGLAVLQAFAWPFAEALLLVGIVFSVAELVAQKGKSPKSGEQRTNAWLFWAAVAVHYLALLGITLSWLEFNGGGRVANAGYIVSMYLFAAWFVHSRSVAALLHRHPRS